MSPHLPVALRPAKVYCDLGLSPDHYLCALVQPAAWSDAPQRASTYQREVMGTWWQTGRDRVVLTDLDTCDVAVLPFGYEAIGEHPELEGVARDFAARAAAAGKVTLVFCHGDRYLSSPGSSCVMFRTSLRRSAMAPADVPLPAWVHDPGTSGVLARTAEDYRERPSVGFVGQAFPLGMRDMGVPAHRRPAKLIKFAVKSVLTAGRLNDLGPVPMASPTRAWSVACLQRSRAVDTSIVVRGDQVRLDMDRPSDRRLHEEFVANIRDNEYGLSSRGMGNYSYRMYEVMAAGRRPVLVESDMPLPRAAVVDWDRLVVPVTRRGCLRIGAHIAAAHRRVGPEGWRAAEVACRQAWADHLSAPGFLGAVVDNVVRLTISREMSPPALARVLR